jgi:hypothetical protein
MATKRNNHNLSCATESRPKSPVDSPDLQTGSSKNSQRARNDRALPDAGGFRALVEQDDLYFRAATPVEHRFWSWLPVANIGARTGRAMELFRESFTKVWTAIPMLDRHGLLDYWSRPDPGWLTPSFPPLPHRPLVQIVEGALDPEFDMCCRFGYQLCFPVSVILIDPSQLPLTIADVLGQIHLLASEIYSQLYCEYALDPLDEWESKMGPGVSHEESYQKLEKLEEKFAVQYSAALARELRRWGFDSAKHSNRGGKNIRGKSSKQTTTPADFKSESLSHD